MNLMMLLEMAAGGTPDRVAVGPADGGLTYTELYERAGRAAARLQADGIAHLAYLGTNHTTYPVAMFAAAWAAIPLLPMNYRLGQEQLVSLLNDHERMLVVADTADAGDLAGLRHPVIDRAEWMASLDSGDVAEPWDMDPETIALLLYTSGTTSAPKAAVLRHRHLVSYVITSVEYGGAGDEEAALVCVPPYHIAGVANLISNVYAGRRLVYLEAFSPETWLDIARREAVTQAMVVPTMLARITQSLDGATSANMPALRSLAYGGSRMPAAVVARALELFPTTNFVNAYGLTETSSTIAVLGPEEHRAAIASDDPKVRARLGSAGQLIPGVEGEVRDIEGHTLAAGETGELWVRGEQVSGEYLGRQSPLDADGWFPTKDRARFDDEGYLFIEGRADDTIIRGGENIAPAEIEDVVMEHPAVADVAVVGPADEEWGQRIAAVVVVKPGLAVDPEELRQFVRARLRGSKTPDQFAIWNELPHTPTGKVLRREILAELETSADPSN